MSPIEKFVSGQDVSVSLPTGLKKSVIYGLLPAIFNRLKGRLGRDTAPTLFATIVRVTILIAYSSLSKLAGVKLLH